MAQPSDETNEAFEDAADALTSHDAPGGAPQGKPEPTTGGTHKPTLRVVAITGAKGGTGKTVIAANVALYLATIGRRVVLVDADPGGANLHACLGMQAIPSLPRVRRQGADAPDTQEIPEEAVAATPFRGLRLLHLGLDEPALGPMQIARRAAALDQLRGLSADWVVVDLGDGMSSPLLDAYLAADVALYVTVPEPPALSNSYQFLRGLFVRKLLGAVTDADAHSELKRKLRAMGGAPAPLDFIQQLRQEGHPFAELAAEHADSFWPHIVINQTRLRGDLELGSAMASAIRRRFGVCIDYVGHIDSDDTVWSCTRSRRPLLLESPGTKSSKKVERVVRRLLAIEAGKARPTRWPSVPWESHHCLLEVDRGATEEEVRRAYKRCKDLYADDSLACYGLFTPHELQRLRLRLEEAYDVLLDPTRRRPYEMSVFPPDPEPDADLEEIRADTEPPPPPPELTPDTQFTGALIRAVRESQRLDLRHVSRRTKISMNYLEALEADDFGQLPPLVYVRGFVTEVAKCLHLDAQQVSRTYVRRYQRYVEEREQTGL